MFFLLMLRLPPRSILTYTLFPYTTLFRSFVSCAPPGLRLGSTLRLESHAALIEKRRDQRQRRIRFHQRRLNLDALLRAEQFGKCGGFRSEEHTSELQSLMRISYAGFCLNTTRTTQNYNHSNRNTNII